MKSILNCEKIKHKKPLRYCSKKNINLSQLKKKDEITPFKINVIKILILFIEN